MIKVGPRLKFRFFGMGRDTDLQYLDLQPEFRNIEFIGCNEELLRLSRYRGKTARSDFAVLIQSGDLEDIQVRARNFEGEEVAVFSGRIRDADTRIVIAAYPNGRLEAFHERDGMLFEHLGPWSDPEVGRRYWFSNIVAEILMKFKPLSFSEVNGQVGSKGATVIS